MDPHCTQRRNRRPSFKRTNPFATDSIQSSVLGDVDYSVVVSKVVVMPSDRTPAASAGAIPAPTKRKGIVPHFVRNFSEFAEMNSKRCRRSHFRRQKIKRCLSHPPSSGRLTMSLSQQELREAPAIGDRVLSASQDVVPMSAVQEDAYSDSEAFDVDSDAATCEESFDEEEPIDPVECEKMFLDLEKEYVIEDLENMTVSKQAWTPNSHPPNRKRTFRGNRRASSGIHVTPSPLLVTRKRDVKGAPRKASSAPSTYYPSRDFGGSENVGSKNRFAIGNRPSAQCRHIMITKLMSQAAEMTP